MTLLPCAVGTPIQSRIDAIAPAIQPLIDAIAQLVRARIALIPAISVPTGRGNARLEIGLHRIFDRDRVLGINFLCGRRMGAQYTQPRDDCQAEPVVGRHGSILPA
ncbi:MAG TPA: hypothetical protein EYQ54_11665 [Myxococcales bacterium]|nr:hypothetical protein [Myxococcales bacterium]